jgi:hypothetical protein
VRSCRAVDRISQQSADEDRGPDVDTGQQGHRRSARAVRASRYSAPPGAPSRKKRKVPVPSTISARVIFVPFDDPDPETIGFGSDSVYFEYCILLHVGPSSCMLYRHAAPLIQVADSAEVDLAEFGRNRHHRRRPQPHDRHPLHLCPARSVMVLQSMQPDDLHSGLCSIGSHPLHLDVHALYPGRPGLERDTVLATGFPNLASHGFEGGWS